MTRARTFLHAVALSAALIWIDPVVEPAHAAKERLVSAVVAAVDSSPITLRDLEKFARTNARLLPPEERRNERAVLKALIGERVFEAEFQAQGIEATDEDVEIYISRVFESTGATRKEVLAQLTQLGLTWEDYVERMRREVKKSALINREVRQRVNVTDEEVRRAWEADDRFIQPDRVEIGHIFIPAPPDADESQLAELLESARAAHEIAARSESGFAKAAREYSKGPGAAEGGRLGVFKRGSMAEIFERAVAGLGEGQTSEPIVTPQGAHIIRLIRNLPTERVPLEEVQDKIRERIYGERLESRFKRWMDSDLQERHYVANFFDEVRQLR